MPDLTNTARWIEFAPDLLGNRDNPRPFFFVLNGSLTKEQLKAISAAIGARSTVAELEPLPENPTDEQKATHEAAKKAHAEEARKALVLKYSKALSDYVKLGSEPLSFNSSPVKSLHDYLDFVSATLANIEAFMEPYHALLSVNSLGGTGDFFSGRLSGGFSSTARKSTQAAAR